MKIPKVNEWNTYFETAYNNCQKIDFPKIKELSFEQRKRIQEKQTAKTFYSSLYGQLTSVIEHFPKIENLSKFYEELMDTLINIDDYKKSLGAINWARFMIKKMYYDLLKRKLKIKEYIGKSKSVLKQVKKDLDFLEQSRKKMLKFPSVKNLPTVLLTGFPNVGKTSLISKLTSSKPEINSYPFTTKNINVGILKIKNYKIQIIDTPGLLERPLKERNDIELKAIIALKHLADLILFLFDTSNSGGFNIKEQELLYKDIKKLFPKNKIITITNKSDLDKSKKTDYYISCKTGEGIEELKKVIFKKLIKPNDFLTKK